MHQLVRFFALTMTIPECLTLLQINKYPLSRRVDCGLNMLEKVSHIYMFYLMLPFILSWKSYLCHSKKNSQTSKVFGDCWLDCLLASKLLEIFQKLWGGSHIFLVRNGIFRNSCESVYLIYVYVFLSSDFRIVNKTSTEAQSISRKVQIVGLV